MFVKGIKKSRKRTDALVGDDITGATWRQNNIAGVLESFLDGDSARLVVH